MGSHSKVGGRSRAQGSASLASLLTPPHLAFKVPPNKPFSWDKLLPDTAVNSLSGSTLESLIFWLSFQITHACINCPFISLKHWNLTLGRQFLYLFLLSTVFKASHLMNLHLLAILPSFSLLPPWYLVWFSNHFLRNVTQHMLALCGCRGNIVTEQVFQSKL